MKKIKEFFKFKKLNEKGQGTAEYVLLLVIVIGLLMAFRNPIEKKINGLMERIGENLDTFKQ